MGAGNGYWGKLLQLRGVDIICYDLHIADDDEEEGNSAAEEAKSDDEEAEDNEDGGQEGGDDEDGDENEHEASHEGEEGESGSDYEEEDEDEEVEVEQIFWTDVLKGTPKVRLTNFVCCEAIGSLFNLCKFHMLQDLVKHSDRTLFLCYPDDFEDSDESMALQCLYNYSGDTIVHVGELFGQSLCLPGAWYVLCRRPGFVYTSVADIRYNSL